MWLKKGKGKTMKNDPAKRLKTAALCLGGILLLSAPVLGGCAKTTPETTSKSGGEAYFDDTTTVILDGIAFDIQERESMVNAIDDIRPAGGYWLVHGHISPHNGYYGFYNTETAQWENEAIGALLTWYGAEEEGDIPFSMDTVVYAFGNELYDIYGNLICKIELDEEESETIYKLKRTSTGVEAYIYNGAMEERVVEIDT